MTCPGKRNEVDTTSCPGKRNEEVIPVQGSVMR